MPKRSKNSKNNHNVSKKSLIEEPQNIKVQVEIDYDKLAQAIVKAQTKVSNQDEDKELLDWFNNQNDSYFYDIFVITIITLVIIIISIGFFIYISLGKTLTTIMLIVGEVTFIAILVRYVKISLKALDKVSRMKKLSDASSIFSGLICALTLMITVLTTLFTTFVNNSNTIGNSENSSNYHMESEVNVNE